MPKQPMSTDRDKTPEGWTRATLPGVGRGDIDDPHRPDLPEGVEYRVVSFADDRSEFVVDHEPILERHLPAEIVPF